MQQPIQSSSINQSRSRLKQLILPGRYYFYLETIISLCLLALLNGRFVKDLLSGQLGGGLAQTDLSDSLDQKVQSLSGSFGNLLGGRLPQILIGMLIGSIVYLGVWLLRNIITDVRNDIVADSSYKHPASYNRSVYWRSVITDRLLLLCIAVVFFGYLFTVAKLLPILARAAYKILEEFVWLSSFFKLLGLIIATVLLLHGLFILSRILANAWRYVFS